MAIELTPQEKLKLLMNSNKAYIENCEKIVNKEGELIPFKLNKAQNILNDIISDLEKNKKPVRIIILKARQMGLSTYSEGYIFKKTSTQRYKKGTIIAHEDKASQNLYNMYRTFYDNLPSIVQPMIRRSNSQEMLFENPTQDQEEKRINPGLSSKVMVSTAKNVNTGRSATIHYLHMSEVAFWDNPDVLCLGLLQCVPRVINSAVIIESTANGVGDWFYNTWQLAEKGENAFIPVFLPWFIQDEYSEEFETENERIAFENSLDDYEKWLLEYANNLSLGKYKCSLTLEQLKWRRYAIKNLCNNDTEQFQQEYPATAEEAFVASGRPRFDIKALKEYLLNTKEGIRGYLRNICGVVSFIEDPKGYVTIYKEPNPNKYYCVGADVAEGLEKGDYSVGIVGSDELNIDAIWHGHIDPDLFGKELVNLATFYNQAYLGVESNNHGLTTLKAILREDYMNIYYSKMHDKATDKITQKIGWVTSNKTKPLMIDKLAEFVREKYLGIPSKLIVKEMLSYVIDEKGKTNAQEGSHDDTVMATAIWLQLVLEGKGDTYVPTDNEPTKESTKRNTFIPNSIDDDIEDDTDKEDYSMECCY